MKRLLALLSLALLVGCSHFRTVASGDGIALGADESTVTLKTPEQANKFVAALNQAIGFVQRDERAALDSATVAGDQVGIDCHQTGLNVTVAVSAALNAEHVVGLISANQALRNARRTALKLAPQFDNLHDKCAAIYPVAATFRPILRPLGLLRVLR